MKTKSKVHVDGSQPPKGSIFVFGSNLSGIHGGGAARAAQVCYGAEMYNGVGRQGLSYAIPTKNEGIQNSLKLEEIALFVRAFNEYVKVNKNLDFFLTRIGCVLAGYTDEEIAPMFLSIYGCKRVSFPERWAEICQELIETPGTSEEIK